MKTRLVSLFVAAAIGISGWMAIPALRAETFFGTVPTGLVQLQDYKYPVFLFVPPNYKPDRGYAMILAIPGEGELPEDALKFWMGIAKRRSMIVLAPTNLRPEDMPNAMDTWILGIMKDVTARYRVASDRIFLIGKDSGAHYAAYLGVQYAEAFSGVALLGGAWDGKFQKLIYSRKRPGEQLPIMIALHNEQSDLLAATERQALEFEKRGYPVTLLRMEPGETFEDSDFRKHVLEWLDTSSEDWKRVRSEREKSFKERFRKWLDQFFRV